MFKPPVVHYEKEIFNNGAAFNILPDVSNSRLDGTTTPSVSNVSGFLAGAVAPITITNFLHGSDWQTISILGDGFTTIANNATIKTSTGANKLLAAAKIYRFTYISSVWHEDA